MTIALRTQPRLHRSGLGTTLWMSLDGPTRALTHTTSNISRETWKWLSTDGPHLTWEILRGPEEKKFPKSRCAKLMVAHLRRLTAVTAAKGASIKNWVKDLNTYVNVIIQFLDWWGEKILTYIIILVKGCITTKCKNQQQQGSISWCEVAWWWDGPVELVAAEPLLVWF